MYSFKGSPFEDLGPDAESVDRPGHSPFPIVGIGASAGGLEAFTQLLGHLPDKSGMAFVLVQHLDPKHESCLASLLSRATCMPVVEATHDHSVLPDHVYVIPPNATMTIERGRLQVTPRGEMRGPYLPIDRFFRSLAAEQQARAIGIVLSGTGSDGTQGLCEIKAVGGITFAQDGQSAKHTGMPTSALASGCVDFTIPPVEIARWLAELGEHPYLAPEPRLSQEAMSEDPFRQILASIRAASGVDFSQYRGTTIRRRILRRMALNTQQSLEDYAQLVEKSTTELEALYRDLLINVTSFFRDPEMFEFLETSVFPEIVERKAPMEPLRVWVPGCSTGQEAYSLAIALWEFFDDKQVRPRIQIFATDVSDAGSMEKARTGVYSQSIESEVTPERLRRFFRQEDHVYRIDKTIRDLCVFARHNVTSDPPFSHMDLISCRNVLIYMAPPLQKQVIPIFHYALNVPGFLVLGTAETVGDSREVFDLVDARQKVYSKRALNGRLPFHLMAADRSSAEGARVQRMRRPSSPAADYHRETDRVLSSHYAPPGVLVNEEFEIVAFLHGTSTYLEAPPGEPTSNVLKMAREGLFMELRSALQEAKTVSAPVHRHGVRVRAQGGVREITLKVLPVRPEGGAACFLVLFEELEDRAGMIDSASGPVAGVAARPEKETWTQRLSRRLKSRKEPRPGNPSALALASQIHADDERDLNQVRKELAATKEYLQSLLEQQDAANQELRSANEEVLSSNEELQSTNEELETAKEELQSSNEELHTVNEQLQSRNVELSEVNNDLLNLLASTTIPVILLGSDLRIRRFTEASKKVMNLIATDVGRPLGDIRPTIIVPDIDSLIREVIKTLKLVEREVRDTEGRWYALRIHPYRTADNRIDGAVVVLLDINEAKHAQELVRQADLRKDEFIATLAHELRNPLGPIQNAVEILRMSEGDPQKAEGVLDMLGRQVRQMSGIVEDLLDLTRIIEKKLDLRLQRIELSMVLQTAVETSRSLMEGLHHQLTFTLPEEPIHLHADSIRLVQVFANLLNNAAKFTERGGHIYLSVERHEREVTISVRDNGRGIAPEFLLRIFDMFTQEDQTLERTRGGLGIGLTLVRGVVEMHGGFIHARSAGPGKGSEFIVHLPLSRENKVVQERTRAQDEQGTKALSKPLRILIVEDNKDQADSLGQLLKLTGHEVCLVNDGAIAVQTAITFLPHVALVDIGLPEVNGYDVARLIRKEPALRDILLVAQTGWGEEGTRRRSLAAGFDEHLVKPIEMAVLMRILEGSKSTVGPVS